MNILVKAGGSIAVFLSLAAIAVPAFASTGPVFQMAKPGNGMSVDDFRSYVQTFNGNEIGDLLKAKSVAVLNVDNAWSDGDDALAAFDAVGTSDQAIQLLREHLKADPAAMQVLAANHIDVNRVIDITTTGNGAVQLYVS